MRTKSTAVPPGEGQSRSAIPAGLYEISRADDRLSIRGGIRIKSPVPSALLEGRSYVKSIYLYRKPCSWAGHGPMRGRKRQHTPQPLQQRFVRLVTLKPW